jgi:hypothetical protein
MFRGWHKRDGGSSQVGRIRQARPRQKAQVRLILEALEARYLPSFLAPVAVGTDQSPFQAVVADVNGDGVPDIVTANDAGNTVSVILSNGDGTFQAPVSFSSGSGQNLGIHLAACHFHGDQGPLDLVVANTGFAELGITGSLNLLAGNGDGSFQDPVSLGTHIIPGAVAVGDFNDDGTPDLVVANGVDSSSSSLLLFPGNGDGTFQDPVPFADRIPIGDLAAADVNGDGNLDLVISDAPHGNARVLLGNGDGSFQDPVTVATTPSGFASGLVVARFHDPNIIDLAVANPINDAVSVVLGNGDGTFQAPVLISTGFFTSPGDVAVGDFNGDGNLDLVATNQHDHGVSVLLGNGDGTFRLPEVLRLDSSPFAVAVGDFNGDGLPDVVTTHPGLSPFVSVLFNAGDANPSPAGRPGGDLPVSTGGWHGAVVAGPVSTTTPAAPGSPIVKLFKLADVQPSAEDWLAWARDHALAVDGVFDAAFTRMR